MPPRRRPRFIIHRLDSPAGPIPYLALWRIEGRTYYVGTWSDDQWDRLPRSQRPADARRLAGGWMVMRPAEGSSPAAVDPPDRPTDAGAISRPARLAQDTWAPGRPGASGG
jgi:hypothetical protein